MRRRIVILAATLALALVAGRGVSTAAAQLSLGEHSFDWTTVEDDRAHFRWSAEIINDAGRAVEVTATVDLLDDDDSVVHSDSATTTLEVGQRRTVRNEGSLPFDRAADVVSFRFRLSPKPPERR